MNAEIKKMLDDLSLVGTNTELYKMKCVQLVERLKISQDTPLKWSQRKAKYDSSCSSCGAWIEAGTVVWLTQGESPRCTKCGRPE
jgi:hypothetical protein